MPEMSEARDLFIHELGDILYAEQLLVKTLPKLAREATDDELRQGFEGHLEETENQVARLKAVFESLGERAKAERCAGMDGITKEHDEFMSSHDASQEVCDLFLAGAGARAEHYEIAAYSGLVASAKAMGERKAADLLQENLAEEKAALRTLEAAGKRLVRAAAKQQKNGRAR
jgi:ferritin-like metal-binding protein YciE